LLYRLHRLKHLSFGATPFQIYTHLTASVKLTGVEKDHGLQTDVLLPLKLEFPKPRGCCQQHVKNLHDALHTLSLLPAETQSQRSDMNKMVEWKVREDKKRTEKKGFGKRHKREICSDKNQHEEMETLTGVYQYFTSMKNDRIV